MPPGPDQGPSRLRRAGVPLGCALALLGGTAVTFRELLRAQARSARTVIGKPLGEEAPRSDGVYKRKYGDPVDLLLLGDSIAAGLGAEDPQHTLGGQLARRLARRTRRTVRLHTAARVGAETSMLRAQLADLPPGYRPDVAVVVVGGNDVTHRVRVATSRAQLGEAIEALHGLGAGVVVGTCPDLGTLRAVPQPLRSLGSLASRQLAHAQREVALSSGAWAVSLSDVVGPFFLAQPDAMFAIDRFHPSEAGYRRTAKALLPSVVAALGHHGPLPFGHHVPTRLHVVEDERRTGSGT
ncbi:SGNH/GDSL hydrolase family protein [Nocardioides solisilvae]|uniref:SGNH/GDSL hydrolase family protein n=1 Tax=Nocardioides solisilvae TaxID=1542435 RepID=UPI000D74FFFC|nr:SGNH/GDSL hydrolase family protein [Nocardioides solisilvae]